MKTETVRLASLAADLAACRSTRRLKEKQHAAWMQANSDEENAIAQSLVNGLINAGIIPEKPTLNAHDTPYANYKPDREEDDEVPDGAHPNVYDAEKPCDCPRCVATRTGMVILPKEQHGNFNLAFGELPHGSHRVVVGDEGREVELLIVPVSVDEYTAYVSTSVKVA